jgi:ribosome-associated toxin RatA of RatAB toxin-antitoxin module
MSCRGEVRGFVCILPVASMPTVHKSAIVPRPASALFALVDDVEHYPDFLPWCSGAEVEQRTATTTQARVDIAYAGLRTHFTTRNRKHAPTRMTLEFVEGPFKEFSGEWRFVSLGEEGCRVEFSLEYKFASAALQALLGPVFSHVAETMVERFVERAERDEPRKPGG